MSDLNVDDFCKDAGRALLVLYRAFPRPLTLFVEDLCGPDRVDEFGVPGNRHLACFSALLWLAEEGLLRYGDTIRREAIAEAVLTARAFTLLTAPAAGLEAVDVDQPPGRERPARQSHLQRLERALAERSSSRTRRAVLELMQAFVGLRQPPASMR